MKIVFVTTQSLVQSTLIGRVMPLAEEFSKMGNEVTVLVHQELSSRPPSRDPRRPPAGGWIPGQARNDNAAGMTNSGVKITTIGPNPFERTSAGKKRQSGIRLIWTMKTNALRAAWQLVKIKPDVIIIVKPLPENTLAVLLAKVFLKNTKIILDVDDFELEANQLTSLLQRAAIHWSERAASKIAQHIIVATPFLGDHMQLLVGTAKKVTLIPTGLLRRSPAMRDEGGFALTQKSKHTILFAGSVSISSGHRVDLLPEILSQVQKSIPDAQLIIAGSGDDEQMLREQFTKLGLQDTVVWHGRFSIENIEALLQNCAVLIDPIDASIANRAKSSFRAALALVYGMPIVTSNIGIRTAMIPAALHEMFFAKPGDASAYAEKIIAIFNNPITPQQTAMLTDASRAYQYDHLAKMYYNCIV